MANYKTDNTNEENPLNDEDFYQNIGISTRNKAFKRYLSAGLLDNKDESFLIEVIKYWENHYDKKVDPLLHLAFMNLTGKKDPRVVPTQIMWNDILPFFNDKNMRIGYSDKNIYDKIINPPSAAETVLKSVRGSFFDSDNKGVDSQSAKELLIKQDTNLIVKPSNRDNGLGIAKLIIQEGEIFLNGERVSIDNLAAKYGYHFIIQKVIKQHSIMAKPHPSSVNTLRMVTLRWKNEIRYLLTFARFGADNGIRDNAGAGGVCLGVNDDGEFLDVAVDENGISYKHHPTTDYCFADLEPIPNFGLFKKFVIELHKDIIHHDFVSWDIVVGANGQPVFLESNFMGATWLYQLATQKPIFGELTEEILDYISKELKNKKSPRRKRLTKQQKKLKQIPKLQKESEKLSNENMILQSEINLLRKQNKELDNILAKKEKELTRTKAQYKKIINSHSWKYTLPFRKLGGIYRNFTSK
ncbi:sugar-transfer associated ATP-grasp domain-containing protein [Virgibacillus natechei]